MSDDLVTWLRQALDDEERAAEMLPMGFPADSRWSEEDVTAIAWAADPARRLAEVAAKRAILDRYDEAHEWYAVNKWAPAGELEGLRTAIKFLAAGLADRPGYQESWRPA